MTERRRYWICLCGVFKSLARGLTREVDMKSLMFEIIGRVRDGGRHVKIRE